MMGSGDLPASGLVVIGGSGAAAYSSADRSSARHTDVTKIGAEATPNVT
jgi:hypothetical protein